MSKPLPAGQAHAGRRADVRVLHTSLDVEAAQLLRHYGGGKKLGTFVSRLVHEHHARMQERQRLQDAVRHVMEESLTGG